MSESIILIAHNIRSAHNVGSLLRTCDGLGVAKVYLTGYSPFPKMPTGDPRLPHIANKAHAMLQKTALGAEESVTWEHTEAPIHVIEKLKLQGYTVAGLEQTDTSFSLPEYNSPPKLALLLGEEVAGINNDLLKLLDVALEIPMKGSKESFNVVEAATMAMYHCTYIA